MMTKFYVYRFLNKLNEVIYVGRTNNLKRRMTYEHFSKYGHLPQQCYQECGTVEFMEIESETEMKIYELYLINKYNPKYNVIENKNDDFTFNLEEHWTEYKNNDIISKKEYKVYSYIIMHSEVGKSQMITTLTALAEGLKMRHEDKLWKLLESLERKGYIRMQQMGILLIINHTMRDLEFPKEECQ
ncbi:GIY-YIG nuclease family protein [Bacillus phage vB_BanS_Nate]|uniref:GIY-YIG nuclease family protein n=1 Tax=Bacillus phage vB_BanS_Nate TaxID=2894788 RepID=A0AAE8YUS1_9CAUD|nr:GIY-YIG nuclease family protein [Bacillus phage vB_BanS_Nate]UGO50977.1 GIY-YIG nuclease family protein [Bacillus phage vB_BanS_Nate]